MQLPIKQRSVLEIGAGIGDLSSFFLDAGCAVTSTEPRDDYIAVFRERYAVAALWPAHRHSIVHTGIEGLDHSGVPRHDVVFCFGVLNELSHAQRALTILARYCSDFLIIESAVHSGEQLLDDVIFEENGWSLPTRVWLQHRLQESFQHVYSPLIQPNFDRYRCDWSASDNQRRQHRVIFVASHTPIDHALLIEGLPERYASDVP